MFFFIFQKFCAKKLNKNFHLFWNMKMMIDNHGMLEEGGGNYETNSITSVNELRTYTCNIVYDL